MSPMEDRGRKGFVDLVAGKICSGSPTWKSEMMTFARASACFAYVVLLCEWYRDLFTVGTSR